MQGEVGQAARNRASGRWGDVGEPIAPSVDATLSPEAQQAEGRAHEEGAAEAARDGCEARTHDHGRGSGRRGAVSGEHDELEDDRGDSEDEELKDDGPVAMDELGQDRHEEKKRLRIRELEKEAPEKQGSTFGAV